MRENEEMPHDTDSMPEKGDLVVGYKGGKQNNNQRRKVGDMYL
jgi:hypothetical protein